MEYSVQAFHTGEEEKLHWNGQPWLLKLVFHDAWFFQDTCMGYANERGPQAGDTWMNLSVQTKGGKRNQIAIDYIEQVF